MAGAEVAGHIAPVVGKQRSDEHRCSAHSVLSIQFRTPAYGTVPPRSQVALLTSVNLI